MARTAFIPTCLLALLSAGGCKHETTRPMPGVLPSAGLLLRCQRVRLAPHLELRQFELLRSSLSNDFYPFNVSRAADASPLVSKLYVWRSWAWRFLDHVELPPVEAYDAPNVSDDGRRIIYERPEISEGEGEFPRAYPRDRRTYGVAIYDYVTDQKFLPEGFSEVYGLGSASFWRPDSQAVAISTTCFVEERPCPQLALLDRCGQVILDASMLPDLRDLEFICHSPDGKRIAALRPVQPRSGGRAGGVLVEVDTDKRAVREVAEVPASLACQHLDHFERLVGWDGDGRCQLRE